MARSETKAVAARDPRGEVRRESGEGELADIELGSETKSDSIDTQRSQRDTAGNESGAMDDKRASMRDTGRTKKIARTHTVQHVTAHFATDIKKRREMLVQMPD